MFGASDTRVVVQVGSEESLDGVRYGDEVVSSRARIERNHQSGWSGGRQGGGQGDGRIGSMV